MKKVSVIFLIVLSLFMLTACSNTKKEQFEVYVNDVGYNIGDELFIEVSLSTTDKDVLACPIVNFYKENEKDVTNIPKSLNFSTDYVEFINLFGQDFTEVFDNNHFSFQSKLSNSGEDINLSNDTLIERIKITLNEKGKYKITLDEKQDEECNIYNKSLKLNVVKNDMSNTT